jgi:dipeptide transport system ATP-binding protein
VPGQFDRPRGCLFSPRCRFAFDACRRVAPRRAPPKLSSALCHTPLEHGVPRTAATQEAGL